MIDGGGATGRFLAGGAPFKGAEGSAEAILGVPEDGGLIDCPHHDLM